MLAARAFARRNLRSARTFVGCRSIGTMFGENCPLVVTPTQLRFLKVQQSEPADLVVLDASWHMPNSPRRGSEEFKARHLPGARFLDLDEVASLHELGLKHMMPSPEQFAKACGVYCSFIRFRYAQ